MTPRPLPNATDKAQAERFVAETYDADPTVCRTWLANHRAKLIRYAADAAMQKRREAEFRKAIGEVVGNPRKAA